MLLLLLAGKNPVSVGNISPPPDKTRQRHMPQLPPPPQAEGRNILLEANDASSVVPAGVSTVRSSLIVMRRLPAGMEVGFGHQQDDYQQQGARPEI